MYIRKLQTTAARLARQYPVVTITGPRQSGKTTLCQATFADYDYVNLEDLSIREFANSDPKGFLAKYSHKVILDEIQRAPNLPSYIQLIIDKTNDNGQFILTGSQQFELTNTINQSLAGRTALLTLLPLSFEELYGKKSSISIADIIYSGFYPRIASQKLNPTEALSFYLGTYVERDIRLLANIKNLVVFERFLKICASQIGQLLNYTTIANDCGIDQKTIKAWLAILEASYIIFRVQPHHQHFRKRLTKSAKLYFYDVALACYLLGVTNPAHVANHPMRGLLFENFIVSEFVKHCCNTMLHNSIYFFRDHVGNEIDVIWERGSQLYSIEIKSSATFSYDFLKGLNYYNRIAKQQNQHRYVVYGGDKSFTTQDVKVYSYLDLQQLLDDITS